MYVLKAYNWKECVINFRNPCYDRDSFYYISHSAYAGIAKLFPGFEQTRVNCVYTYTLCVTIGIRMYEFRY